MKNVTKKLVFLLFMGLFLVIGYWGSTYRTKAADGSSLVSGMSLKRDDVELEDSTVVYKDDVLDVRYSLKTLVPGTNIIQGETYEIPLPSNLLIASSNNWDVTKGNLMIAHCEYDGQGTILVKFDDALFTGGANIDSAYIGFFATVDDTGKEAGDSVTIDPPSGATGARTLVYGGETKPTSVTVSKTGSQFDTTSKEIEWTVIVTEGPSATPTLVVKDTISDGQEFMTDTFTVDGQSATPTVSGTDLTYTLSIPTHVPNKNHVIKYKTKVYPVEKEGSEYNVKNSGSYSTTAKNEVSVHESTTAPALTSADAKVTCGFASLSWVEKKYKEITIDPDDSKARLVTWEVKVDTNGYTFHDVVINDIINAGSTDPSKLQLVAGSFEMLDASGAVYIDPISSNAVAIDGTPSFDSTGKCEWKTKNISTLEAGKYTITYQMRIKDYLDYKSANTDGDIISNEAWATYGKISMSGLPGVGPGKTPSILVDAGGVATHNATLKKINPHPDYAYDGDQRGAEVHGCPWIITVNEDRDSIPSTYYLIEEVGANGLGLNQTVESYTDASKVIFDVKVNGVNATAEQIAKITIQPSGSKNVRIDFDDLLDGNTVEFRFQTYLTDQEYYEGQHWTTDEVQTYNDAWNNVVLYDETGELLRATASIAVYTNVLQKFFVGYDYSSHIVTWQLPVDRDMQRLDGAKLTDTLTGTLDHVEIVKHQLDHHDESLGVRSTLTTTPDEDGFYYTYDDSTRTVEIVFDDGIEYRHTYTVYIFEKLDPDDKIDDNGTEKTLGTYNGTINITNNATLLKEHTSPVKAKATGVIDNKVFNKTAKVSGMGKATYTVEMNQAQKTWPANAEISDIMSEGLTPDVKSFVLKEATIDSDGKFTEVTTVDSSKYDVNITVLDDNNTDNVPAGCVKTVIKLPADAANKAYILTYDVYVDEAFAGKTGIDFVNTVTVNGNPNDGTLASKTLSLSNLLGYGSGTLEYSRVKLVKKNEAGDLLEGAEFELIYDGEVLASETTDANGEIVFSNLTPGAKYILHESKAPAGYVEAEDVPFTALDRGDDTYINSPFEIEDPNVPVSEVMLVKKAEDGTLLPKAEFALLLNGDTVDTQETNADGVIIFTDLTPGETYVIRELTPPEGYALARDEVFEAPAKGDTKYLDDPIVIIDKLLGVSEIKLVKKNEDGDVLENAKFNLIHNETVVDSGETDADGEIIFTDLEPNEEYTLVETEAPKGYKKAENKTFTSPALGDTKYIDDPIVIIDKKIGPSEVKLVKKNEDGKLLPGAKFDLILNETVVDTATTDDNGEIIFTDLIPGEKYTIKEVQAPEGYELAANKDFVAPENESRAMLDDPIVIVDKKKTVTPPDDPDPEDPEPEDPIPPEIIPPEEPVPPTSSNVDAPKTGDNYKLFRFAVMALIASGLSLVYMNFLRRRRYKR